MINTILYSVRQAFRQILRNRIMLGTSLFSITAMMVMLGLFFALAANLGLLTQSARNQFDQVEVYLEDTITNEHLEELEVSAKSLPYVDEVQYISKEDALLIMKKRWGRHGYLLDGLSGNPLPASLQVQLNDIGKAGDFVEYIIKKEGVEDISCRQDDINKIIKVTNHVQIGAMIIILLLVTACLVVVVNSVKLTVMARGRAISIMKYVGATNWFIRGPFLLEGIVMGALAAILSILAVTGLYYVFVRNYGEKILVMFSAQLIPVPYMMAHITMVFMVIGISIGATGSLISMRKFLDA